MPPRPSSSRPSVDVPLAVRLEPALVRVRDAGVGEPGRRAGQPQGHAGRAGCSCRAATRNAWCASPSRRRRWTCSPASRSRARVRVEAPQPEPGQEVEPEPDAWSPSRRAPPRSRRPPRFVQVDQRGPGRGAGGGEAGAEPAAGPGRAHGEPARDHRQPARRHGPPGVDERDRPGTGGQRSPSGRRWSRSGPGQIARTNLRLDAAPPRPGAEVVPAVHDRRRRRRPRAGGAGHLRPGDVAAAARRADDGAAGAARGPRPQRRRPERSRWSPTTGRRPAPAGHALRVRRRGRRAVLLRAARCCRSRRGSGRRRPCRCPRRGRNPASRRAGRSPWSPRTASGTRRRPAASSRRAATGGRCGGCCSPCSAAR